MVAPDVACVLPELRCRYLQSGAIVGLADRATAERVRVEPYELDSQLTMGGNRTG